MLLPSLMLCTLPQSLLTTLLLLMLSTLPLSLPMLPQPMLLQWLLPLLTMSLPTRRHLSPTPTPTESLMTTPRPTSTLLRPLMLTESLVALTLLPPPTAVSRRLATLLTMLTATSPRSPTREFPFTPRPSPTSQLLPQPTMPKPSVCLSIFMLFIDRNKHKLTHKK